MLGSKASVAAVVPSVTKVAIVCRGVGGCWLLTIGTRATPSMTVVIISGEVSIIWLGRRLPSLHAVVGNLRVVAVRGRGSASGFLFEVDRRHRQERLVSGSSDKHKRVSCVQGGEAVHVALFFYSCVSMRTKLARRYFTYQDPFGVVGEG